MDNEIHIEWPSSKNNVQLHKLYNKYIGPGIYIPPKKNSISIYHGHFIDFSLNHLWMLLINRLIEIVHHRTQILEKTEINEYIIDEYHRKGIKAISKKYNFPPLALIRKIIKQKGESTHYDKTNYKIALKSDVTSPILLKYSKQLSITYENKIIDLLKKYKVNFKTETDLINEQIKLYGKPKWTVDILFTNTEVYINGKRIYWIEIKSYMLTDNAVLLPKTKKQLLKYKNVWGDGAVIYKYGYTIDLNIDGVLVLDGRNISDMCILTRISEPA